MYAYIYRCTLATCHVCLSILHRIILNFETVSEHMVNSKSANKKITLGYVGFSSFMVHRAHLYTHTHTRRAIAYLHPCILHTMYACVEMCIMSAVH